MFNFGCLITIACLIKMDVFKLVDGFSTQAKVCNRYWLTLMVISIISIINLGTSETTELSLPFGLGNVSYEEFISVISLMLCATTISYTSAFLQMHRTRELIQKVIHNTKNKYKSGIHIQDIFDSFVTPTFNRVAPISQFLQGEHQFLGELKRKNSVKNIGITVLYILLKMVADAIIFIIPLYALGRNFKLSLLENHYTVMWLPVFVYWIFYIISMALILLLICVDCCYILKVVRRILHYNTVAQ